MHIKIEQDGTVADQPQSHHNPLPFLPISSARFVIHAFNPPMESHEHIVYQLP